QRTNGPLGSGFIQGRAPRPSPVADREEAARAEDQSGETGSRGEGDRRPRPDGGPQGNTGAIAAKEAEAARAGRAESRRALPAGQRARPQGPFLDEQERVAQGAPALSVKGESMPKGSDHGPSVKDDRL